MAAKSSSSLRLDDFVNAVHADPANVEPTMLLAGYLGRSPEEGNVRVYLDPGLSNWVEVPEAEVIHSRPIADSPLGGSQLWVRASAQIRPGAAGAQAQPAAGEEGDGEKAAVGADTGVFNPMATIHPTLWTQFCPTAIGCQPTIPCLPPSIGCPQGGQLQGGPTGWYTCVCPIGPTGTQGCGQGGPGAVGPTGWHTCACPIGPTGTQGCGQGGPGAVGPTGWHTCACPATQLGCPNTVSCPPAAFAASPSPLTWAQCPTTTCAEAVGPTGTQGCTQPPHCVPNSVIPACMGTAIGCEAGGMMGAVGPTGTQGCTQAPHCVGQTGWHTCACPIGPTGYQGCGGGGAAAQVPNDPTAATRCFICPPLTLDPTSATRCFICPPIEAGGGFAAAAQGAPLGPTGTQGCTQTGHCVGQTGWHTCACPIGPTGTQGCGTMEAAVGWPTNPTASTRCFVCPPFDTTALAGGAQAAFVGPTGTQGCAPLGGFQQSTAATLCTQIGCQPRQSTAATLCTHYGCPPGGPVITLVTVSGCPHPSWVDACPTRMCGVTVSGPCLPYTLGGCFPGGRPF